MPRSRTAVRFALPAVALAAVWAATVFVQAQGLIRPARPADPQPPPAGTIDFASQIVPIISERCLECHSAEKRKGGLSLASYDDVIEGGRSGSIVRPGRGADSIIVHRLLGTLTPQMPEDDLVLDDAQIALIQRWIDEGARATPTSAPAPPPWEPPLTLTAPEVPAARWSGWDRPLDRIVADYMAPRTASAPAVVSDRQFARRAYLDIWGLLPQPEELAAFERDASPDKRDRLVERLLADPDKYAQHWITFWNDLLRNEEGVSYFSEDAGRKSITDWLLAALESNMPYDQFVKRLINPSQPGDPEGFLIGVNWRGERSAAVTPWMQASQNTSQVFLGVNLKCNACHDSFVSRWKLKDAYAMAAFFSPDPRLQLFRCDVARDEYATAAFLYPELDRTPASSSLADRRVTAAAIFTDPRNGRLARTVTNRVWERLLGHGVVPNSDEMDGKPWSPDVLDWVAADFVAHGYDLRHLLATIVTSRAYQLPAVMRTQEPPARHYVFEGPEIRRLTAEQFTDALGTITGEWSVYQPRGGPAPPAPGPGQPVPSDPTSSGAYGRQWRAASTNLTRALGRPIRDQVISVRAAMATTPQLLELVNGDELSRWLDRGARRMLDAQPPEPPSLYTKSVGGRSVVTRRFDIDVTGADTLWLIVEDTGSNAPERVRPVWAGVELVDAAGNVTSLGTLTPQGTGLASGPATLNGTPTAGVRVVAPSTLRYTVAGRGFVRLRGTMGMENTADEIGSTLNPSLRFYVFNRPPGEDRLIPVATPAPTGHFASATADVLVDRVFALTLGRAPTAAEREVAIRTVQGTSTAPTPAGLADLLWALLMTPEFQLIS